MKITKLLIPMLALPVAAHAATFVGNTNSGFGGVLGTGSLEITDDGSNLNFSFTKGASDFNDSLVIYLDTAGGGFTSTSTFTDSADGLRRAVSGFDGSNRSTVNFNAGFGADYALGITASGNFAGLFNLDDASNFTFNTSANLNPNPAAVTDSVYTFTVSFASIGISAGDSVDFVATYLNDSNAFRSNEAIGDGIPDAGGVNPGNTAVTFTSSRTYSTVPEPSAMLLGGMGIAAFLRRMRRR